MQQNDPMLVAMAAVFLASKSENHGKAQLHQIIGWFFKIKYAKDKETGAKMFGMLTNPQQCEWLRDIVLKVCGEVCLVVLVWSCGQCFAGTACHTCRWLHSALS
jgi:hypothetical protein